MAEKKRRKTEYKTRSFVRIDGVYHPVEELDPDYRREIFAALNERAMRAAGYVPAGEVAATKE